MKMTKGGKKMNELIWRSGSAGGGQERGRGNRVGHPVPHSLPRAKRKEWWSGGGGGDSVDNLVPPLSRSLTYFLSFPIYNSRREPAYRNPLGSPPSSPPSHTRSVYYHSLVLTVTRFSNPLTQTRQKRCWILMLEWEKEVEKRRSRRGAALWTSRCPLSHFLLHLSVKRSRALQEAVPLYSVSLSLKWPWYTSLKARVIWSLWTALE